MALVLVLIVAALGIACIITGLIWAMSEESESTVKEMLLQQLKRMRARWHMLYRRYVHIGQHRKADDLEEHWSNLSKWNH